MQFSPQSLSLWYLSTHSTSVDQAPAPHEPRWQQMIQENINNGKATGLAVMESPVFQNRQTLVK